MTTIAPIKLYALRLTGPSSTSGLERWSFHYINEDGSISPLWGWHNDADPEDDNAWNRAGRKAASKWPYMVFSKNNALPAFHFAIQGFGYSKLNALAVGIANTLQHPVEIHTLSGHTTIGRCVSPYKDTVTRSTADALAYITNRHTPIGDK